MAALIREGKAVLNQLTFAVIVQNLVRIDELRVPLKQVDSRKHFLVKPIFKLVVSGKVCRYEILKLSVQLLLGATLGEGKVLIVGINAVVFVNDVLKIVNHRRESFDLVRIDRLAPRTGNLWLVLLFSRLFLLVD